MNAQELNRLMRFYADWAGLPRDTLIALAMKESSYNPVTGQFHNVCNFVRACGLMQLRPNALADIKRVFGMNLNPLDPVQSIVGAAALMLINTGYLQNRLGRQPTLGALIAAYNGGWTVGIKLESRQNIPQETAGYLAAFSQNYNVASVA